MAPSSQQQSKLLPTIGKSLLLSSGLLVSLFQYLMGQLHIQSIEMKHMDPTDIVLVPFELNRLIIFVLGISCFGLLDAILLRNAASSLPLVLGHWIQATSAFWIIAVICGAPPTQHLYHTLTACSYLATLTILLPQSPSTSTTTNANSSSWWQARLALPPLAATTTKKTTMDAFQAQFVASCQVHFTLFLTVPFQVLRLYDWGSQIQRWPLPIVLGSTYGFVAGSAVGSVCILGLSYSQTLRNWYEGWTTGGRMENNTHQD